MNMKKTFGIKKLIILVFSLALAVALAACSGTGSPANGNGFDPFVGNHGGVNFFIEEGVDRGAFISEIQAILLHLHHGFAINAPYIYSFTRTLGGGRHAELSLDGRAIVYCDGSNNIVASFAWAYTVLNLGGHTTN